MNLAFGRLHLAFYLEAPVRSPLLSRTDVAPVDPIEQTYRRQTRLDAAEADRQRWAARYSGSAGWRV